MYYGNNLFVKLNYYYFNAHIKCLCHHMSNAPVNMSKLVNVINVQWIEHETVLVRVKRPNYQLLAVALHLLVVIFWIHVRSRWRTGRAPSLPKLVQGRLFFLYKEKILFYMNIEVLNKNVDIPFSHENQNIRNTWNEWNLNILKITSENSVMLHNI